MSVPPQLSRAAFLEAVASSAAAAALPAAARALGVRGRAASASEAARQGAGAAAGFSSASSSSSASSAAPSSSDAGASGPVDGPADLTLMLATDMHFLSPALTDGGEAYRAVVGGGDAKVMDYCGPVMDAFVDQVLAERPDAVVIPGDLSFNGALRSHRDMASKLGRITAAGIPVCVIPGNHDVYCPYAASFTGGESSPAPGTDADQFLQVYEGFGPAAALARDDASLSYVYEAVPLAGRARAAAVDAPSTGDAPSGARLRLLMVDCNAVESPGTLPASTAEWVRGQLADAAEQGVPVVAVSHQNALSHTFADGGYVMDGVGPLLDAYEQGGVRLSLTGHIHCQHVAVSDRGLTEVATSSLVVSPIQYARVELRGLEGGSPRASYRTHVLDVAGWAARQADPAVCADPDLADFASYARGFFAEPFRAAALQGMLDAGVGEDEAREAADYQTQVTCAWFAGTLDRVVRRPDLEGACTRGSALAGYFLSYVFEQDPPRDGNAVEVSL